MASEKQIEANRANAQKSTGPRTEAGKRRSSLNALRHGLTGQVVLLPEEDLEAFNGFTAGIVASFKPFDAHERQLAQSYASFQWRINRAAGIEDSLFTLGIIENVAENLNIEHPEVHNATSNAKTYRAESREFERLSMYSQRLVNQASRVLKELKEVQAERRERQQDEMDNAIIIYKAHAANGLTFNPQEIGFECTLPQIEAVLRRRNLKCHDFIAREIRRSREKAA